MLQSEGPQTRGPGRASVSVMSESRRSSVPDPGGQAAEFAVIAEGDPKLHVLNSSVGSHSNVVHRPRHRHTHSEVSSDTSVSHRGTLIEGLGHTARTHVSGVEGANAGRSRYPRVGGHTPPPLWRPSCWELPWPPLLSPEPTARVPTDTRARGGETPALIC